MNKDNITNEFSEDDTKEEEIHDVVALIRVVSGIEDLENIRINSKYEIFCSVYQSMLGKFHNIKNWRYNVYNTIIYDMFTAIDEALAMILLKNTLINVIL